MKTFYLTDAGKVREHNEDNLIILKNSNDEYLLAVADGMGGHKAGEVASSIAIKYIEDNFKDSFGTKQDAINWLRESATNINDAIFAYTKEHVESKGMGTTLVASILTKEYLLFANIGDSRGFVVKDDKLFKVT